MATLPQSEILGSNNRKVELGSKPVIERIKLAEKPLASYARSYTKDAMDPKTPGEPDRAFLKFENVTGNQSGCVFDVSVKNPKRPGPGKCVGSLALFGLERASDPNQNHGGSGLNKTIEITQALDAIQPELLKAGEICVKIAPRGKMESDDRVTIGQINLVRLSGQ